MLLPNFERPWESGSKALARKLSVNEFYPYYKWDSNHLQFQERPLRFYWGLVVIALSAMTALIFVVTNEPAHMVYPTFPLVFGILFAFNDRHTLRYTLNHITKEYTFTCGCNTYRGGYHSVYIRLRSQRRGDITVYYLILNGYMMIAKELCGYDESYEEVSKLGMQLAANLKINYFDDINLSKYHVVRNFPSKDGLFQIQSEVGRESSKSDMI